MKWKKIKHLFKVEKNSNKMYSHAAAPIPVHIKENIYHIYFSSRDKFNTARPFFLVFDIENMTILETQNKPLIETGGIGNFDEKGIILTDIIFTTEGYKYYYVGFPRFANLLYSADSGMAVSKNINDSWEKLGKGPIITKSLEEPLFSSVQCVIEDNNEFKMWYVSGVKWKKNEKQYKHYYNIRVSTSKDGITWSKGKVCIDFKNEFEYALARSCVIKDGPGDYKMWYCFRAQKNIDTYRIGYAESFDGISWERKDELMQHFDISVGEFDSEMICYPYVFDHKANRYMLYNGNGYGKTGFGIAKMIKG